MTSDLFEYGPLYTKNTKRIGGIKMKKNLTELVFILDRSGSMCGLEKDTIGGFNSLIKKQQKEDGNAYVSAVLFDDNMNILYDRVPIEKIKPMTERDYYVGGCTALLDAVGNTINHIGTIHKHIRKEDIPEKTLVIITTDGMENASRNFSYEKIKKMIEHQKRRYHWEFIFLGENIDAADTAETIGIDREYAADYCADEQGTALNYEVLSNAISSMRKEKKIDRDWNERIKEDHRTRGRR